MRRNRAFTIVEMLVVISIIVVLISLIFPFVHMAREQGLRVRCTSNMRQLTTAWIQYYADNDRLLVSSNTWSGGWVLPGNSDADVSGGLLFKYLPTPNTYRCPSDLNLMNERTYSINCVLNGEAFSTVWTRATQINNPVTTFVFIDEYDYRGFNINSFGHYYSGDYWVDRPAHLHGDGTPISFADGHVQFWHFSDPRTYTIDFGSYTPKNVDLQWFLSVCGG